MQPDLDCLLEGEVLRLAQRGNASAFQFLYRFHRERVYSLCLSMVKDPVQAEDLTQEAFLAALREIREFRGQSAFSTWLRQVTRNTVLMRMRKKKLDEKVSPESESGRSRVELEIPDRHLEATPDPVILQSAVSKLPLGFRKTPPLRDLHGYEHGEVAATHESAPGTFKSQLHRAGLRLREFLKKCFRGESHKLPTAPAADKSSRNADTKAKSQSLMKKRERDIPSWCEPIDEEPLGAKK